MAGLVDRGASKEDLRREVDRIRLKLNPHPGGQLQKNVPRFHGEPLHGFQHKYKETVLFFPAQGQTCHAYCAYCFRWAQFIGMKDLKQASRSADLLVRYLRSHRMVSDLLVTGGDPFIMSTRNLAAYIDPILEDDGLEHVRSIRLGTKALAFWPYRFLTDPDADDLLRLMERCVEAGRHVAVMAHFSHGRELETRPVEQAIRRILDTGAVIRTQAPLVRHVNDDPVVWSDMWRKQVSLGCVPYYMFVERDTGARHYFEVPLDRAFEIYREACTSVSGLARTARGPSMSATPGKVTVDGVTSIRGEKVFCLRFLQARNPAWVGVPFFARFDPRATWLDQLQPAFGEAEFFFERDPVQDWRQIPASGRAGVPVRSLEPGSVVRAGLFDGARNGSARSRFRMPRVRMPRLAPRQAHFEELQ
jgi:L-lysine 2,3-aminomutase